MQTLPPVDVEPNDLVVIHVTGETNAGRGEVTIISGVSSNRKVVEALTVLTEVFRLRAVEDEAEPLPPSAPPTIPTANAYAAMTEDEKLDFAHGFNDLHDIDVHDVEH